MTDIHDTADLVIKALRRARQLGQDYWQYSDSEYRSDWKKADATLDAFDQLVADTKAALTSNSGAQPVPTERGITTKALSEMFLSLDGYDKAQPGYEWRKGWNDAIRQAMDYAQPAPSVPDDGVLKDAERYRFLEHLCATGTYRGIISRKDVDAAMLAAAPEAKP